MAGNKVEKSQEKKLGKNYDMKNKRDRKRRIEFEKRILRCLSYLYCRDT